MERVIRYIREAFFAARKWRDLDDLNAQAQAWCQGQAAERPCPEDRSMSVREAFAQEQLKLLALPANKRVCDLVVSPHELDDYDQLQAPQEDEDDDHHNG